MYDEQQNLGANFTRFINEVAGEVDFRMAIVTTDHAPADPRTGYAGYEYAGSRHYEWSMTAPYQIDHSKTSTSACVPLPDVAHACFRGEAETGFTVIDSSKMTRDQLIGTFERNVVVGSCGDGNEAGLKSIRNALAATAAGKCNANFLRPEANLVIVIVSDEEDTSCDPGTCTGREQPDRRLAVRHFVDDTVKYKPYDKVRVAAIVGSTGGEAKDCRVDTMGRATDACGSLCRNQPPLGSQIACGRNLPPCTAPELCLRTSSSTAAPRRCTNPDLASWDAEGVNCGWCSFYKTPDCCSAKAGGRYVDFARQMEQKIAEADRSITATGCNGSTGAIRAGCRIDSVCQAYLGDTLAAIATDLVRDAKYTLDPPALYGRVRIVSIASQAVGGSETARFRGRRRKVAHDREIEAARRKRPDRNLLRRRPKDAGRRSRGACGI